MKPIGGFFELEVARANDPIHPGAIALTNGRACLRLALAELRPRRVFVPHYTCDALLQPIQALDLPFAFYPINRQLEPLLPNGLQSNDAIVVVNYFGLKSAIVNAMVARFGSSLIIDATQSFFDRGPAECWLFNSARKFFGVPDGAYLYSPMPLSIGALERNVHVGWRHLTLRLMGQQQDAYRSFLENERNLTSDVLGMSLGSERVLAGVDYRTAIERRRANFALYADALMAHNQLQLPLGRDETPFCYPFLPATAIPVGPFHERGLFIPTLWHDCIRRPGPGFEWERDLASRLLPLPVDHRLDADDVGRVIGAVEELMKG